MRVRDQIDVREVSRQIELHLGPRKWMPSIDEANNVDVESRHQWPYQFRELIGIDGQAGKLTLHEFPQHCGGLGKHQTLLLPNFQVMLLDQELLRFPVDFIKLLLQQSMRPGSPY